MRRKAVEGDEDPTTRQTTPLKTCRGPPVWRGAGGGAEKAIRQINHRKGTMARQTFVERKGNTGANTREKSRQKPPARSYLNIVLGVDGWNYQFHVNKKHAVDLGWIHYLGEDALSTNFSIKGSRISFIPVTTSLLCLSSSVFYWGSCTTVHLVQNTR